MVQENPYDLKKKKISSIGLRPLTQKIRHGDMNLTNVRTGLVESRRKVNKNELNKSGKKKK